MIADDFDPEWCAFIERCAENPAADPTAVARRLELDAALRRALASCAQPVLRQPAAYESPAAFARRLGVDRKTIDRQLARMTEGVHYLRIGRRVVICIAAATAYLSDDKGQSPDHANMGALLDQFDAKVRRRGHD